MQKRCEVYVPGLIRTKDMRRGHRQTRDGSFVSCLDKEILEIQWPDTQETVRATYVHHHNHT